MMTRNCVDSTNKQYHCADVQFDNKTRRPGLLCMHSAELARISQKMILRLPKCSGSPHIPVYNVKAYGATNIICEWLRKKEE